MFRLREPKRRPRDPVIGKIDGIRRSLVGWGLGWGWLCVTLFVAGMIFAGVLLDHAFVLQRWGRVAFLRAFLFSSLGALLVSTLWPILRRTNRLYIARRMETERPELKNTLISYLEVRDDPRTPHEIKRLMRRKAYRGIQGLDAHVAVDGRRYVRLASALGAVVVAFVLYSIISPKSTAVSMERLLWPGSDILPPTATQLVQIIPGDLYVISGDEPEITVHVGGRKPESAQVVWAGQTFADRRVLLAERRPGVWEGKFPPILEDGNYYVAAGDTRSELFNVRALPKPVVTRLRISLKPPDYTGLPPQTLTDGDVEAVKGSELVLTAWTSVAPGSGRVEFSSGRRQWMELVPSDQALRCRFKVFRSDSYVIRFETIQYPNGAVFENRAPVRYSVVCREDQPPTVRLLAPPDRARVGPRDVVTLRYDARDDFRVDAVRLYYRTQGMLRPAVTVGEPRIPTVKDGSYRWDLAPLAVGPGTQVAYYLEAQDSRPDILQVGRSAERTLVITGPDRSAASGPPGPEAAPGDGDRAGPAEQEGEPEQAGAAEPQPREAGEQPKEARPDTTEPPTEPAQDTQDRGGLLGYADRIEDALRELRDQTVAPGEDRQAAPAEEGTRAGQGEGKAAASDGATTPAAGTAEAPPAAGEREPDAARRQEAENGGQPQPERERTAAPPQQAGQGPRGEGRESQSESTPAGERPSGSPPEAAGRSLAQSSPEAGDSSACPNPGSSPGGSDGSGAAGQPSPAGTTQGAPGAAGGAQRQDGNAGPGQVSQPAEGQAEGESAGSSGQAGAPAEGRNGTTGSEAGDTGASAGNAPVPSPGQEGPRGSETPASGAGRAVGQPGPSTGGQGGSTGAPAAPRGAGPGSSGRGVDRLPTGLPADKLPAWQEADVVIEELANMLQQDSLPPDLLEKLGTNRDELTKFVDRYRQERDRMRAEQPEEPGPRPEPAGHVAEVAGPAAEDIEAADGLPAETEKDVLRSRFEGASDRLSPRYRDVVDRYYRELSRE